MAAEGQPDKMASDFEVHMKKRCGIEFFHAEKLHSLTSTLSEILRKTLDWDLDCYFILAVTSCPLT